MLGFLDESGDTGLKIGSGSSRFFVAALVTFGDDAEALRCDGRIAALRAELQLPASYEFHFARNPRRVRERFLQAVAAYDFGYHAIALDKHDDGTLRRISTIDNVYEYMVLSLIREASPFLSNLTLVLDERGNKTLRRNLARSLRANARLSPGDFPLKRIKQQASHKNHLLQLADYVASVTSRELSGKADGAELAEKYLLGKRLKRGFMPK